MTYNDLGFRELYHRFVAIKLDDKLKKAVEGFKDAEEADGAILYGYIDHEAGFTFEVIAAGRLGESGIMVLMNGTNSWVEMTALYPMPSLTG